MTQPTEALSARRNPPWVRDEVILACDLVWSNDRKALPAEDPRVIDLSELLQIHTTHPPSARAEKFRNPNGVGRKTADIATNLPGYPGKPTNGGRVDKEVINEFLADPLEMSAQAAAIRVAIRAGNGLHWVPDENAFDLDFEEEGVREGSLLERRHLARERDPKIRHKAVRKFKAAQGAVFCQACGFNFSVGYGQRGEDFAEVHHRVPLSVSGETVTKVDDLVLLCSNCHRMIHRRRPWLTFDQLVELVQLARET